MGGSTGAGRTTRLRAANQLARSQGRRRSNRADRAAVDTAAARARTRPAARGGRVSQLVRNARRAVGR